MTSGVALGPPETETIYAPFIFRLLCSAFFFAACIFDFSQLAIQKATPAHYFRPLVFGAVALWATYAARRSWSSLRGAEPTVVNKLHQSQKQIRITTILMGALLLAIAALFGYLIGKNRLQLQTLNNDLAEYRVLGDSISKARSHPGTTVSDYLQMYIAIEDDTNALDRNISRLLPELSRYLSDFPEFSSHTEHSIQNVEITRRRILLLHQQIETAKRLQSLDANDQLTQWRTDMLPLLEQEEKLDEPTTKQ